MLHDNAFAQINRLRNELEYAFSAGFDQHGSPQLHPKLNVWEDAENFRLEMDIPGVDIEKIEIDVHEGKQLSIKGERKQPVSQPTAWIRKERSVGKFARSLTFGCSVDVESVKATVQNGVLEIQLPKSPAQQPRRIEISTGI